ncbi:MAG: uridylate kinase [Betaproteobacteria bacterium HGW-Betaproteobacteria-22]|nr:MAG: uridylate kinase [Betaproteobacteria bacterium HGW-Betaproteobacteria-22]
MWVVKLGGSLLGAPALLHWLETLIKISDGKVLIVPGGGVFADAVRQAQQRSHVDDAVAHTLALMAMDQFGLLLAGMHPQLTTASSELEIAERGWQHRAIVWLPSKMVLADESVPKNWQITSDSLSAWLANKISAEQLILVKSKSLTLYQNTLSVHLDELIQNGLVDSGFGLYYDGKSYHANILHKNNYAVLADGLELQTLKENSVFINTDVVLNVR